MNSKAKQFCSTRKKNPSAAGILLIFSFIFLFSCGTTDKSTDLSDEILSEQEFISVEETDDFLIQQETVLCEEDVLTIPEESAAEIEKSEPITVLFAGDIMCHKQNYVMGNFNEIYEDISAIVKDSDLALANIEAPVDDKIPFSNYPEFNMNSSYVQAAIDAGFNVFSLANNHTNDQGLDGILATYDYFMEKEKETFSSERPVYACGIKKQKNEPLLTYRVIEIKGWKILFAAVTESLNRPSYSGYIDYLIPSEASRNEFIKEAAALRENNPCDLFILSVHTCEPEYIRNVNKKQNAFYRELMENGVDVVWANHPHVAKDWEIFGNSETGKQNKIIFNAMGNTISGQRRDPQFKAPETERDYTGDGYMIKVTFDKNDGICITAFEPYLITTYITPQWTFVIKQLNDSFIETLENANRITWAKYLAERKKLMEKIKGIETWQ